MHDLQKVISTCAATGNTRWAAPSSPYKLYTRKLLPLKGKIEFSDNWIAALLHDAGKLVLGLFFWDWFDQAVRRMQWTVKPFHKT